MGTLVTFILNGFVLKILKIWQNILIETNFGKRIGPWIHFLNGQRTIGDEAHGVNGTIYNLEIMYLKWYDKHLKNMDNDISDNGVRYYVVGEDKWHTE